MQILQNKTISNEYEYHLLLSWKPISFMGPLFSFSPIFTTFLLVASVVLVSTWKKLKTKSSNRRLPPGPWRLPVIGNLHQLAGTLPQYGLRDLAIKYGPVMHLKLGRISQVVVTSPEAAREVMRTNDIQLVQRPFILSPNILTYNDSGLVFAPYGDRWREMKKILVTELTNSKRVQSFRSVRQQELSSLVKNISDRAGLPVNISGMLYSLTNCIIGKNIFGKSWNRGDVFKPLVHRIFENIGGYTVVDFFPSAKLLHLISGIESKVRMLHKESDELVESIINERRSSKAAAESGSNGEVEDLADVLLNLLDQDQDKPKFPFTRTNIKALLLEILVVGSETSATTIEWAMTELIRNPSVMKKLQSEVRQVMGKKSNIEPADLEEMKYLKLVLKETLRLHFPNPLLLPRQCQQDIKIGGYDIPAKTNVMINGWAIARDPLYWNDAERFYPERFLDTTIDFKGTDFEFLPFGSGRRMCPGIPYTVPIIELCLANLLCHFDWKLPNGMEPQDLDMAEATGLIARRKNDLYLVPVSYLP